MCATRIGEESSETLASFHDETAKRSDQPIVVSVGIESAPKHKGLHGVQPREQDAKFMLAIFVAAVVRLIGVQRTQ